MGHNAIRYLSVCSGIEAASVAWGPLGWQPVAFAEIEKFPSAVLAHHYPDVPNLGDFSKIDTTELGRVDVLCGGTPCQAFSVAGLRQGLADARGNLTLKFVELAHALADGNGLRNAVWENVVGVLSDRGNAFGCFIAGLVGADAPLVPPGGRKWTRHGMVAGPKGRCAWAVKDAQFFGVAQRRRRVLVVADFGNGADPAAVLFEPESLSWNSAPRREAGEGTSADVAPSLVSSGRGVERTGDPRGQDPVVACYTPEIARCVATREGSSQDYETTTMVAVANPTIYQDSEFGVKEYASAGSLRAGRIPEHQMVIQPVHASAGVMPAAAYDIAPTLRAGTHSGSHANAGVMPAVTVALRGREGGATAELGGHVATALRASTGGGDKPHVLCFSAKDYGADAQADLAPTLRAGGHNTSHANAGVMPAVAFAQNQAGEVRTSDIMGTLNTNANASGRATPPMALQQSAVRRLTPVECERLQGFPDNYTAIPWRGKPAEQCPDGPRYKALGNSWAVPKFTWLGARINAALTTPAGETVH